MRSSIGIVFVLLFLIPASSGCLHRNPTNPGPNPNPQPESKNPRVLARTALTQYGALLAENFQQVEQQLRSGKLTTAAAAHQSLSDGNATARKQAFLPLDQYLQTELGGDNWNNDHAASIFHEIALGLSH